MKENLFNELKSKQISKDIELENKIKVFKSYFVNFFNKYSSKKFNDLINLSDKDILLSSVIVNNPLKTKEILDVSNKYCDLFNNDNYNVLFSIFACYYNDESFKKEIDNCLNKNILFKSINMIKLFKSIGIPFFIVKLFFDFIKENPYCLEDLGSMFNNFSHVDNNICVLFISSKHEIRELLEDEEFKSLFNSLNGEIRKLVTNDFLPQRMEYKMLFKNADLFFDYLNSNYNNVIKEYEKKEKERRRFNKNILDLIKELDTNYEIKNIDSILKLCPDSESINLVIDFIISHNESIYEKLVYDYENALLNSDENLNYLFSKYDFDYGNLNEQDRNKLKELGYLTIENLLKRVKVLSLRNINFCLLDFNKLSVIESLIYKNIITKDWLILNASLLYSDNNILDLVISNLDILSNENVNILSYSNSLDILKSNFLKLNLGILKTYNLVINKNTSDINFLSSSNLIEKIDFIISNSLYQGIISLDILNYSFLDIRKLKIANILNIPVSLVNCEEDNFSNDYSISIIPNNILVELNKDINDICELPSFLEVYYIDKVTLNINGVLVSSEKVKRCLARLKNQDNLSIFYAIIYNGYYSYEEILNLSQFLLGQNNIYSLIKRK